MQGFGEFLKRHRIYATTAVERKSEFIPTRHYALPTNAVGINPHLQIFRRKGVTGPEPDESRDDCYGDWENSWRE